MQRLIAELRQSGIADEKVLAAIGNVDRERFVTPAFAERAWENTALPIAFGQTISQPLVVAIMTELAEVHRGSKVLEVGTGSGYQAAVLAEMGADVFTIEIVPQLAARARRDLDRLGYRGVHTRTGDGFRGWPEEAPFDAIIVTAAPREIPPPLKAQLAVGGHLVIPLGEDRQELRVATRTKTGFRQRTVAPVAFVPMTGEAQEKRRNPGIR
jgi:protein-L-isoaspartate(D-aspartate) O-methyltransferase